MSNLRTAKRLKEIRESLGMDRDELAEKFGVTKQVVANMEIGRKNIYAEDLMRLCKIFNMTCEQFFNEEIIISKKLTLEEANLINLFDNLSPRAQEFLMEFAENLKYYESQEVVTLIPMLNGVKPPVIKQVDFYDQAAGMGLGQIVENPVPKKIDIVSEQVPDNTDFVIRVYGDSMEPTYHSNDRLFIQSTNILDVGDIGVFSYNGEQLVKEYGKGELISHNKKYAPIKIDENLYIQGKVLGKVE